MTLEEYKKLLLDYGIIECDPINPRLYLFTQKGMNMIEEKFPGYPTGWNCALEEGSFWGIHPEHNEAYDWNWYYEKEENQKVMENTLKNVFHIDLDDSDYIELEDIVL